VLCSSYSGNTEETLGCFAAAEALGARRLVAGTGGKLVDGAREGGVPVIGLPGILPAPRTAVAYMLVCAAEVAAAVGAAPRIHTEIDAAAAFLEQEAAGLQERAEEIVGRLGDAVAVVTGADLTAPVARRWKTQINENAELPAFFSELPEADHNELCGWSGGEFSALMLEDRDQHPRERRRFELTAELIAASGAEAVRIETEGETRIARLLWATMLGDLVSLRIAEARGVDPLPVAAIEGLKVSLAGDAR
jgi:glucose/mannose-6-phosphate isomerase